MSLFLYVVFKSNRLKNKPKKLENVRRSIREAFFGLYIRIYFSVAFEHGDKRVVEGEVPDVSLQPPNASSGKWSIAMQTLSVDRPKEKIGRGESVDAFELD